MANGDHLVIGVAQPPDNRATSLTMLVHNGSPIGTQHTAFWVRRVGAPICNAAIRGDNNSTGPAGGVTPAGVVGAIPGDSVGIGVLGTATGAPNVFFGETGVMGVTNSFGVVGRSLTGVIVNEQGTFVAGTGVVGQCDAGVGVHGVATSGWGIIGQSNGRAGVTGRSVAAVGVEGLSEQGLAGVRGQSDRRYGVLGESREGVGVLGVSPSNAIQGRSTGSGGASIGVSGWSNAGAGVQGDSNTGIGVAGRSQSGWAGYFEGNVIVRGGLFVVGGPKSAVVKHPDGTDRSLFCLESPESYFEDFGEAVLTGESVVIRLDTDFAALVKRNKYQVFLTSYDPAALYVSKRGAEEFEIARVAQGAEGSLRKVRVGYRIVARRADLKPARLPKIKMPSQAAEVNDPDVKTLLAKVEPLPAPPRIPSPDLKAMSESEPIEPNGDSSNASDT